MPFFHCLHPIKRLGQSWSSAAASLTPFLDIGNLHGTCQERILSWPTKNELEQYKSELIMISAIPDVQSTSDGK